jgi:hypothetical protein
MAHPEGSLTMNRRDVVAGCVATAAVPLVLEGALGNAPSGDSRGLTPLFRIVYEGSAATGRAFGHEAARLGGAVREIRGDMTQVWYEEIAPRWRQEGAAIAGLTAAGALFCFEQLAWDAGMRVVYRAQHSYREDGTPIHALQAPAALHSWAGALSATGERWSEELARRVMRVPAGLPALPVEPPLIDLQRATSTLLSWVIAPVRPHPSGHRAR